MNIGGTTWSERKTLVAKGHGRMETSFRPKVRLPQSPNSADGFLAVHPAAAFTVTVKGGHQSDVVRGSVPVLPYGAKFQLGAAGAFTNDATFTVAPSRPHWTTPTLRIAVSSNVARGLLDLLLDATDGRDDSGDSARPRGTSNGRQPDGGTRGTGEALPSAAERPEGRLIDENIHEELGVLIALAAIRRRLARPREAGRADDPCRGPLVARARRQGRLRSPRVVLDAAIRNIRQSLANNAGDDLTVKAVVLHALALRGQGDFSLANQLLRDRKSLAPLSRAYLALALVQMDRKDSAAEIVKDPETSNQSDTVVDNEAQAVTALVMLSLNPGSRLAKALIQALLARRQDLRWNPENATGPAVMAAVQWLARNQAADAPCQVSISVNGKAMKTLRFDPNGPTQTVNVPTSFFVKGKQRIVIHSTGAAPDCVIAMRSTGVEPAENVAGASPAWHIERSYEPPLIEVDDRTIPRGFTAARQAASAPMPRHSRIA